MMIRKQQNAHRRGRIAAALVSALLVAAASPGALAMVSEEDREARHAGQADARTAPGTGVATNTGPVGDALFRMSKTSAEPLPYEEAGPVGRLPTHRAE